MTRKLKMFVAAALAALAISVGGLVAAPSASAMPKTCAQAQQLARAYIAVGDMMYASGAYSAAAGYYGRALGLIEAAC